MSDRSPAIAVWEFASIAEGANAADAIAKGSPITALYSGTTHPGKYVVLVTGDTASVEVATVIVDELAASVLDVVFLPDVHVSVADAIVSDSTTAPTTGDSVGIVETRTVSSGINAADAAVKTTDVSLAALRMADGLGGKAYFVVEGVVSEVEAAVEAGVERAGAELVASVVIPQVTDEVRADLATADTFLGSVRTHRSDS